MKKFNFTKNNKIDLILKSLIITVFTLFQFNLHSQVVINELMPNPAGANTQCVHRMFDANTQGCGNEWVELYNTSSCYPVDISCYYIGAALEPNNFGVFSFPPGTIIPPGGFLTVGGGNSGADIVLADYYASDDLCASDVWILINVGGWLALYQDDGTPENAVYWTSQETNANQINGNPDFDLQPLCIPPNSCGTASPPLASAIQMLPDIEHVGGASVAGTSFSRTSDGASTWQKTPVNTFGTCNAACLPTFPSPEAGVIVLPPQCPGSNISANAFGFQTNPNFTQTYILSNGDNVVGISPSGNFTLPNECGTYTIHSYNYLTSGNSITNPSNINQIICYPTNCCDLESTEFEITSFVVPPAPSFTNVSCATDIMDPTPPNVFDSCGNMLPRTGPSIIDDADCVGAKIYTWTYTDCNNNTYNYTSTFLVPLPTVALPPNGMSTVNCLDEATQPDPASITDSCGTPLVVINSTSIGPECADNSIVYTFNFEDCVGQPYVWSYTYTILEQAVVLNCPIAQEFCEEDDGTYIIPPVVASDDCGNIADVTYTITGATTRSGNGPDASGIFEIGVSTITWSTTSSCNAAIECTTVVTINDTPDLSLVDAMCAADFMTYNVNFMASSGTISTTAGTVSGNSISGIMEGQDITITADNNGCISTLDVPAPDCGCDVVPDPTNPNNPEICEGEMTLDLTVDSEADLDVNWYNVTVDGTSLGTGNSFTPTDTAPGTYTYYAEAHDTNTDCFSNRIEVVLTIHELPAATIDPVSTICEGDDITLTASGGIAYIWSNGGGTNNTTTFTNITSNTTYTATVTDGNDCVDTADITVEVDEIPTLSLATDCGANPADGTGEITATATIEGGGTLEYSIDGINFQASNVFGSLSNGSYTISVQEVGSNCLNSETVNINCNCVLPSITIVNPSPICQNIAGDATSDISGVVTANDGAAPEYFTTLALANAGGVGDLADPTVVMAGTYFIRVNSNADPTCFTVESVLVEINPLPIAIIDPVSTICEGDDITLTASGGTGYMWSNGGGTNNTATFTNLTTNTTYTVTITDANDCTDTEEITVEVDPLPTISLAIDCGANPADGTGEITVTSTIAGGGVLEYSMDAINFQASNVFGGLANGSYTITVREVGSNCLNSESITINCNCVLPILTVENPSPICQNIVGDATMNLTTTITGNDGTAPEYYSTQVLANAGGGGDIADPTAVATGTYFIRVNSNADPTCFAIESVVVEINELPIASINPQATVCEGDDITLTANGGISYNWSNGGGSNNPATFTNVALPTTYTVTVTDANNCTDTEEITVQVDGVPTVLLISDCGANPADGTGEISVTSTVTGGGALEYSIDGINFQASSVFGDLVNGNYTVTVRIVGSDCSNSSDITINCNCTLPILTVENPAAICQNIAGNASIDLTTTITGNDGTAPEYYSTQNLANAGGAGDIANPAAATNGIYFIRVNNAADPSCFAVESVIVEINELPVASINPVMTACEGDDITLTANGGISYNWSNGGGTNNPAIFTNVLSTSTFEVTVTDANNCTDTEDITVQMDGIPTLTLSTDCGANPANGTGEITATSTVTGGGSIEYSMDGINFQTSNIFSDLTNGSYTITVRLEGSDCIFSEMTNVTCDCIAPIVIVEDPAEICQNETGTATVDISNVVMESDGAGSEFFTTEALANIGGNGDIADLSAVEAGTYFVRVNSNASPDCFVVEAINVIINELPTSEITATNTDCVGDETGAIALDVMGGNPNYTFSWTPNIIGNPEDPEDLATGIYSVLITDLNGCQNTNEVEIFEPAPIVLDCSATGLSVPLANDGIGTINISGGTPNYSISWDGTQTGNDVDLGQGDYSIEGLEPGNYSVTIIDANNCEAICDFTVQNAGCNMTATATGTLASCAGACDATITLDIQDSNGVVQIDWGNPDWEGLTAIENVCAGAYTVAMIDAAGCTAETDILISEPESITLICEGNAITGFGNTDGQGNIGISGGTAPYTVNWTGTQGGAESNIQAGNYTIDNLAAGDYEVIVIDANNCEELCSFRVDDVVCLIESSIEFTNETCLGDCDGTINLTVENAIGDLTITWEDSSLNGLSNIGNLCPGAYNVTITDEASCSTENTATITALQNWTLVLQADDEILSLGDSTELNAISGISFDLIDTLIWIASEGEINCEINCLNTYVMPFESTYYQVTMIDTNGCQEAADLTIIVDRTESVFFPNVISPNNDGVNDFFFPQGNETAFPNVEELFIYDRWGNAVFVYKDFGLNNPDLGWDGTYRGDPVAFNVYVYYAKVLKLDGTSVIFKGDVTLVK